MKMKVTGAFLIAVFHISLYAQNTIKIAVIDFQTNGIPQFIGSAVSDIITTEIKKDNDIIILERNQIQQIFKERNYQKGGCTNPDCAIEYGQMLSVDKIIIGSVSKIGDSFTITGKIVEIKSGAIEYMESENCSDIESIEPATRYLATKLLNRISRKHHALPEKNYQSKTNPNPIEISLSGRYGVVFGFKVPQITIPSQYPDQVRFTSKEQIITIVEGVLAADFYTLKGFSIKGLLKYSYGMGIEKTGRDDNMFTTVVNGSDSYDFKKAFPDSSFQGVSIGTGLQYNFNFSRFIPFISGNIILSNYWFNDIFDGILSVNAYPPIPYVVTAADSQSYKITFSQYTFIVSTEIAIGFKMFFNESVGMVFGIGATIPLYGSLFNKYKISKTNSSTSNNRIPPEYKDLETKLKFNEKNFIQPPTYFVQVGFVYRI